MAEREGIITLRNSERSALRQCPQKWYWSSVEGLEPRAKRAPLWFGSAVHESLDGWYQKGTKRGEHPAESFKKHLNGDLSIPVSSEDEEIEYANARDLGVDMLTRYVEEYGEDPTWDVIATERKFQVSISSPGFKVFGRNILARKKWLRLVGTTDGVYRDMETGRIWLMEHKTAKAISTRHLNLDDQAGTYWAILNSLLRKEGILKRGENLAGIKYNFLRKAMGDTRPRNPDGHYCNKPAKDAYVQALSEFYEESDLKKMRVDDLAELAEDDGIVVLGEVSKSQPPEYFLRFPVFRSAGERRTQIDRLRSEALFARAYRDGDLPILKSPSRDCSWCQFEKMCTLDEQGDQLSVEEFKSTQFIVRDVHAAHNIREEERDDGDEGARS